MISRTIELTEQEYKSTMTGKMTNVTESVQSVVDIWPYVELLRNEKTIPEYVFTEELVESVYINGEGSFHHVLLSTDNKSVFVVLIVDVFGQKIKGHFNLDLNQQYELP